ncbi:MAG: AAA family ATPase [Prochloraceae cyanobacterium]
MASLGAKEAQNRFVLVFHNFIKAIAGPEHPLVLFLDDLQWADGSSLELLETMMNSSEISHLLLIGAYRDNEVDGAHPLMLTINELLKTGTKLNQIDLLPLPQSALKHLLADTFNYNSQKTETLAELIEERTGSNPFFVNEFLRSLYANNLLYFDHSELKWQWNLVDINAQKVTENIVNLLIDKIQKSPLDTQQVLKLAACLGNQFEIKILALIAKRN